MMRFGSLFTGIGGFDLGLEQAGMECAWQVEFDKYPSKILAKHWPEVPNYGDITAVDPEQLEPIDLLCGGFPCQDVSIAGRRAGLAGERTGLFWEVVRLAGGLRPRWLLLENVPGLLSSNKGADFATVLEALGELGYGLAWRVLDSQHFGLAQRRKRVFIVGYLGGPCPPEVLFEPEGGAGDTQPGREAGENASALTRSGLGGGGPDDNLAQARHIIPTMRTNNRNNSNPITEASMLVFDEKQITSKTNPATVEPGQLAPTLNNAGRIHCAPIAATLDANYGRLQGASGQDLNHGHSHLVSHTLTSHAAKGGDPTTDNYVVDETQDPIVGLNRSPALSGKSRHAVSGVRRLTPIGKDAAWKLWGGKAGGGKGYLGHPEKAFALDTSGSGQFHGVRRLTPVECERLQGFPDGWTDILMDTRRYRALGNAVSVPVAQWIGERVIAAEGSYGREE